MKKILGLTIAFMLLIGMGGIGTWAYFQDTETSTGNVLAAGTLDLKTDTLDGVTQTLYAINLKPGDSVSGSITLKNAGTVDGSTLDLVFSYGENDDIPNPVPMSADATAAMIEITTLNLGVRVPSLLSYVSEGTNANGWIDMQDLTEADLTGQAGINSGSSEDFVITVQLRAGTSGDFLSDGINITMTFTLNQ